MERMGQSIQVQFPTYVLTLKNQKCTKLPKIVINLLVIIKKLLERNMTLEIIVNSFEMLYKNFKAYMKILLPYILLSFFTTFIVEWNIFTIKFDILDVVIIFLFYYLGVDAIVKIHRFNILNDTNFFEYGIVRNFKYIIASLVLFVLVLLCYIPIIIGYGIIFEVQSGFSGFLFVLGIILTFFLFIYILPYVFVLPIIATDNKLKLKEFVKSMKGFRLTFVLQFLFLGIIGFILIKILTLIYGDELSVYNPQTPQTHIVDILYFIFRIVTFAYTINLITETFIFWNKKYNFYSFE